MFANVTPPPQTYLALERPAEVRIAPTRQELPTWHVQQDQFQAQNEVTYASPNYQEVLRAMSDQSASKASQPIDTELLLAQSRGATDTLLTIGVALAVMSFLSRAVSD